MTDFSEAAVIFESVANVTRQLCSEFMTENPSVWVEGNPDASNLLFRASADRYRGLSPTITVGSASTPARSGASFGNLPYSEMRSIRMASIN